MGVLFGMKVDCEIPAKTSYQFSCQQKEAVFFLKVPEIFIYCSASLFLKTAYLSGFTDENKSEIKD